MEELWGIIFISFILFLLINNKNNKNDNYEQFMPIPQKQILGPSIVGNMTTDYNNFNYIHNNVIDPYENDEVYSRIMMRSYEHNMINNFKENNTKRSLAYASIKQILFDTKTKLNDNNLPITFNTINIKEIDNINIKNKFKTIINKIIDAIISTTNSSFYFDLNNDNDTFKVFKEFDNDTYFINYNKNIHIIHSYDDNYEKNQIFNNENSYESSFFNDVLTTKNPLILKLIIQFVVTFKNNDLKCNNNDCYLKLQNNMDIYINSLSCIKD